MAAREKRLRVVMTGKVEKDKKRQTGKACGTIGAKFTAAANFLYNA